jgi:fructan beta-fructosidase
MSERAGSPTTRPFIGNCRYAAGMERRAFLRGGLLVAGGLTVGAVLPRPAFAGEVGDYPEFPYPSTAYGEAFRGQFHFSPRAGWMNDPNGLVHYRGEYHFFFQHNPHGLAWDTMHWGHATSTDLVHWTQRPIALEPGVHPGDLWSGAGVVDSANTSGLKTGTDDPIVVFSGTNGVTVAYSTDGARTFQSYAGGRKVVVPSGTSRDPKVLWDAARGRWVMVVFSDGGGNGVTFATSPDLLTWTVRSRYAADWLFECPDFFPLPCAGVTAWVLTCASGLYVVGAFDGTTFSTTFSGPVRMDWGRNDAGGTFYAGQTFNDMPDGRRVQMVWQPSNPGSVWTNNASFPVELALVPTSAGPRITRQPVAEIALLRTDSTTFGARTVTADPASDPFAGLGADTYEISATFDPGATTASRFGFQLHRRADGTYDRAVVCDRVAQTLDGAPLTAPLTDLRLLVDRGQLEIFGNGGLLSKTDNVRFDSSPGSQGIRLFAEGGSVRLVSASLHRLGSAWGVGEPTLVSTLAGPWRPAGGTWEDVTAGKRGTADGDGFYYSSTTAGDLSYEGDLRLDTARAAGLTFRDHYTANIDAAGLVKLWRPGSDLATYRTPIQAGRSYHLKVVATGPRIRVYLDHGPSPVIDVSDGGYGSGLLGANVFAGAGTVQNLVLGGPGFVTANVAGPWHPVGGTWTVTPAPRAGLHGANGGDAFFLSATAAGDVTYEGDLTVVNGVAAALTIRASADAGAHYTANIDTSGMVKLWRPGQDLGTHETTILEGRTYHLKVVAAGARLQVYFDHGPSPVIDVTDGTYASGLLGVNIFRGHGVIQNLRRS